jgi:hypothetical protein
MADDSFFSKASMMLSSCFGRCDDGVAAATVQNAGVHETRARAGGALEGGVDGCPGTGVSLIGKRDPPELLNIFRGTPFQWRRCVRTGTSTAPWPPMRGGKESETP